MTNMQTDPTGAGEIAELRIRAHAQFKLSEQRRVRIRHLRQRVAKLEGAIGEFLEACEEVGDEGLQLPDRAIDALAKIRAILPSWTATRHPAQRGPA